MKEIDHAKEEEEREIQAKEKDEEEYRTRKVQNERNRNVSNTVSSRADELPTKVALGLNRFMIHKFYEISTSYNI